MIVTNNAAVLKSQLMLKVAEAVLDGELVEKVDSIPVGIRPRGQASTRCCIWRDRAIIRYRLIAILGGRIEDETDEIKPLSEYAAEALSRKSPEKPILTVLDEIMHCLHRGQLLRDQCVQGMPCEAMHYALPQRCNPD